MKKILFLINTLQGGGAEKVLVDTVNAMDKQKYDITVQTVIDSGIYQSRLDTQIKYKSIVKCKNGFLRRAISYIINFKLSPGLIHRLFVGRGYDYEIAFLEGIPTKVIGASADKNSKKYAWVHIDLYNTCGQIKAFGNDSEQIRCYKRFDKIICVSDAVKEAFLKRFGIKNSLDVRYNIIDDEAVREKAKQGRIEYKSDLPCVVTVGRLEHQKGYDRLLKIHKRLTEEGIRHNLFIVGEGSCRKQLESYIAENNLTDTVTLTGFSPNPYVYMNMADVMVFPSRAEGLSTVAIESLILGKPIVASACAGMHEIFGNSDSGMVVENTDDSIYAGLRKMLTDSTLRNEYADKALKRSADFTKQNRINELDSLFNNGEC